MATHGQVSTLLMLAVCIVGVIIGDSFLYIIGRVWGSKLVELPFIRKKLLTPEKLASIAENFQTYGVKILLFARLTPGIRAPIFLTAGITKLPLAYFLIADGIYAIPGVTGLFFLSYWFTDSILELVDQASLVKPIIGLVVVGGCVLYFVYHFWKKPVVTGAPAEMPPIVGPVTEKLDQVAESMADKVLHRSTHPGVPDPLPPVDLGPSNGDTKPTEASKPANQEAIEQTDGRQ
jgi:membrane protein DedA with SNARE-associated domain